MATLANLDEQALIDAYLQKNLKSINGDVTILFNMVASIDGITTIKSSHDSTATERGLSNDVDKKIMQVLRSKSDCILNGANTLRLSGTNADIHDFSTLVDMRKKEGLTENPIAAVITTDAAFTDDVLKTSFFTDSAFQSVLFVAKSAPESNLNRVTEAAKAKQFDVIALEERSDNVKDLVHILHDQYKVTVLLVEGGSGINGSFIKNGLGNDFFLTTSPHIAIGSHESKTIVTGLMTLLKDQLVDVTLDSAYYNDQTGCLFEHWQLSK